MVAIVYGDEYADMLAAYKKSRSNGSISTETNKKIPNKAKTNKLLANKYKDIII